MDREFHALAVGDMLISKREGVGMWMKMVVDEALPSIKMYEVQRIHGTTYENMSIHRADLYKFYVDEWELIR